MATFPFTSGDSFRALSHIILNKETNYKEITFLADSLLWPPYKIDPLFIFIELASLEDTTQQQYFINFLGDFADDVKERISDARIKLIFHNGDKTPNDAFYLEALNFCDEIYSVNILDFHPKIIPIPIGLENLHIINNSLNSDFQNFHFLNGSSGYSIDNRKNHVFTCFSKSTNPSERGEALSRVEKSRFKISPPMPPLQFRNIVKNSLFVISPPGNGEDTHRTWESLALGAIPVIKKGSLGNSLIRNQPILAVDCWDEFLLMSDHEMEDMYVTLTKLEPSHLFINKWMDKLDR